MQANAKKRESFPDEHLTYWSDVYVARDIRSYGVLLETFLSHPQPVLAAIDTGRLRPIVEEVN